jgi:phosphoglycerol transferase MdoB-like AlkP superfamily enzyme
MLARLKFLLGYALFWILFFELSRLIFLIYHFNKTAGLPVGTMLLSFLHGLRLDLSMTGYLIAPVCIFVLLSIFLPIFRKGILYKVYTHFLLFILLIILVSDLELYRQWGFRIDATPLKYIQAPQELWASISHLPIFLILVAFLVVLAGFGFLASRWINRLLPLLQYPYRPIFSAILVLLFTAILIIPIRGGFQLAPINQSSVYFSKHHFANVTAINAPWNFVHGVMNSGSGQNPYLYMDQARAVKITDSLYRSTDSTQQSWLRTTRPNVLLIIWESFTAKALEDTVDGKPVVPGFLALKKEGIYFSQVYASGDRTDKGLAAVLSGYPAMNNMSIIRLPGKSARLQTLSGMFKDLGYQTNFYYGGEPEFANIKSYILQSRFEGLVEKADFPSRDLNSKWGAHDGVVANRLQEDLAKQEQPFFTTWLTLTSHEPFETPLEPVFQGRDQETRFLNSIHYTDDVLYQFIRKAKTQAWWENTLVVILADHGHPMPDPNEPLANFRIPMLWLGGALAKEGMEVDRVASQLDLASTLALQVDPGKRYFPFSKNILDTNSLSWAYFSFNNGFGFVQPGKAFVFDNVGRQVISRQGNISEGDIEAGKAMQQQTFQDYLDR